MPFGRYTMAARKFVDVNAELGTNYRDVISPQDVAVYGGLCALASFDRAELKAKVICAPLHIGLWPCTQI